MFFPSLSLYVPAGGGNFPITVVSVPPPVSEPSPISVLPKE
ncbi:hypothetical protein [Brachyspira aalborgi]|nr:hypothetical protein [Brachyspira aalborgi]